MRTWLLTSTTYGTWLPGDRRGSVTSIRDVRPGDVPTVVRFEHDLPGEAYEEPIPGLAASAHERMAGPPVRLDTAQAAVLVSQFRETAAHRGWRLLAAAVMWNHFHLVVRVDGDPAPQRLLADFKAYGSRALNRRHGRPASGTWWTTNGSKRKVRDVPAAVNYVLRKQPNPLALWDGGDPGEPGA